MTDIIGDTRSYYEARIQAHGPCPQGVDWGSEAAQRLRFGQLFKLLQQPSVRPITLNDLGCGYGAFCDYLIEQGVQLDYLGIDLAPAMVDLARARCGQRGQFIVGDHCPRIADYSVASGIFNVRNNASQDLWQAYVLNTLDDLAAHSRLGFAFNCLTSYCDPERMRPDLYYADPLWYFDWCKRKYARNVALLHDYGLYDFTIIVRKDTFFEQPG